MDGGINKGDLRRWTERLHMVESSLKKLQKGLDLCIDMERDMASRRALAMLFGMPLACVAFVCLTFLVHNFGGNGLYYGMGAAFLCWLVVRPAIVPFDSPRAELEGQVKRLIRSRERTKEALQEVLDAASMPARPAIDDTEMESEAA